MKKLLIASGIAIVLSLGGAYVVTNRKPIAHNAGGELVISPTTAQANVVVPTIPPSGQTIQNEPQTSPIAAQTSRVIITPDSSPQIQPAPPQQAPVDNPKPTITTHVIDTVINTDLQRVDSFCTTSYSDGTSNRAFVGAVPIGQTISVTFDC